MLRRIFLPYNNSVHIFFISSILFKNIVYFMFFNEIVVNLSVDENEEDWELFWGIPLMCLIAITDVLKVIEMVIHSRMAYLDPRTMLIGKMAFRLT